MSEWRPRRAAVDAATWAVLCLPVAVGLAGGGTDGRYVWGGLVGLPLMAVAVLAGRRWPLLPVLAAFGLSLLNGNFVFAVPLTSVLAGYRADGVRAAAAGFTGIAVAGTAAVAVLGEPFTTWAGLSALLVLAGVTPWLLGRCWRQYQELVRAGWDRAERLERERHAVADRARLLERARIAQDMHDSLGHELSLLALRAGALELSPGLSAGQRLAAGELRSGAAEATARLHDIIGVLRAGGDVPATPSGETVAQLAERARASGLDVTLGETGEPPGPASTAALALHRVVQEALTNAARHAPGAPVRLVVAHDAGGTDVRVTNPLPVPAGAPAAGGGHGLTGLRERVRLAGGTFAAAPAGDRFELTAHVPRDAGPPAEPDGDPAPAAERDEARRLLRPRVTAAVVSVAAGCLLLTVVLVVGVR